MRLLIFLILVSVFSFSKAQRNLKPKMAPVYSDGYYVSLRNDTIRGQVQVNPESDTDFYKQFYFKTKGPAKARLLNAMRAKAYGFDGREFVQTSVNGKKTFYERLVTGRLRLYEQKVEGKKDGYEAIVSEYFIRDTRAEEKMAELKEPRKISQKYYKKALKPYLADQPMIWSDLDKFEFNPDKLVQAVKEFNSFYAPTAN